MPISQLLKKCKVHNCQYGILSFSINVSPSVIMGYVDNKGKIKKNDKFLSLLYEIEKKANEYKIIVEILDTWMMMGVQNLLILFRTSGKITTVLSIVENWMKNNKFNTPEAHTIDFSGYCNISDSNIKNKGFIDYIEEKYNESSNGNGSEIVKKLMEITEDSPYLNPKDNNHEFTCKHGCWKKIQVTEFWCDNVIPVLLNSDYEEPTNSQEIFENLNEDSTSQKLGNINRKNTETIRKKIEKKYESSNGQKPLMLMYLRIYRVPLNSGKFPQDNVNPLSAFATPQNIIDLLNKLPNDMKEMIKAIFFTYGLYDLIIVFETCCYNKIDNIINAIRVGLEIKKKHNSVGHYHVVGESTTLINFPLGNKYFNLIDDCLNILDLSINLIIWAGYEEPYIWQTLKIIAEIMDLGEKTEIKNGIVEGAFVNSTQGYYDYVIIVHRCKHLDRYIDFITLIDSLLPFVQGSMTTIRYPFEIGHLTLQLPNNRVLKSG